MPRPSEMPSGLAGFTSFNANLSNNSDSSHKHQNEPSDYATSPEIIKQTHHANTSFQIHQ